MIKNKYTALITKRFPEMDGEQREVMEKWFGRKDLSPIKTMREEALAELEHVFDDEVFFKKLI